MKTRRKKFLDKPRKKHVVFNGKAIATVWLDGPKAAFFLKDHETGEIHPCGGYEDAVDQMRVRIPKPFRSMVHLRDI